MTYFPGGYSAWRQLHHYATLALTEFADIVGRLAAAHAAYLQRWEKRN